MSSLSRMEPPLGSIDLRLVSDVVIYDEVGWNTSSCTVMVHLKIDNLIMSSMTSYSRRGFVTRLGSTSSTAAWMGRITRCER
jgi:hypothetical protein